MHAVAPTSYVSPTLFAGFPTSPKLASHFADTTHRTEIRKGDPHLPEIRAIRKAHPKIPKETRHPLLLFESLLTRYYINPTDVKCLGLFRYSEGHHSACPYKGVASYFSATINDKVYEDIVWTYPYPLQDVQKIQNRWCFYNEKVEMILDGEKLE